jgi:hypothetical protein
VKRLRRAGEARRAARACVFAFRGRRETSHSHSIKHGRLSTYLRRRVGASKQASNLLACLARRKNTKSGICQVKSSLEVSASDKLFWRGELTSEGAAQDGTGASEVASTLCLSALAHILSRLVTA